MKIVTFIRTRRKREVAISKPRYSQKTGPYFFHDSEEFTKQSRILDEKMDRLIEESKKLEERSSKKNSHSMKNILYEKMCIRSLNLWLGKYNREWVKGITGPIKRVWKAVIDTLFCDSVPPTK